MSTYLDKCQATNRIILKSSPERSYQNQDKKSKDSFDSMSTKQLSKLISRSKPYQQISMNVK